MKVALLFGVLLGVLAVPAARPATADEPQSNPPPFSLYIRALRDTVAPGSPVRIEVTLTNVEREPIVLGQSSPANEYDFIVRDDQGGAVAETETFRQMKYPRDSKDPRAGYWFSFHTQRLRPGEALHEVIDLSQLYDLSGDGSYSVQLARSVPAQPGSGVVTSNAITVGVSASVHRD
jgi:hypothetical protein